MIDVSSREFSDAAAMMAAMAAMAELEGYTVEYLPDHDQQPRTCMKTKRIFLPRPTWKMDKKARDLWRGMGHHECGHHDPSQQALVDLMDREKIAYDSNLGLLINAVDDVWQEMVRTRKFAGAGQCLSSLQAKMCSRGSKYMSEGADLDKFVVDVLGLCYHARSFWQPDVALVSPEFDKHCDYSKWVHLTDRINDVIDHPTPAEELYAICREMLEAEGRDPDSEEEKGSPKPEKGEGEGEGEEAEGEGGTADEDGEADTAGPASAKVSYEKLMGHSHSEDGAEYESDITIEYDHKRGDYTPYKMSEFQSGDPRSAHRTNPRLMGEIQAMYEENAHVSRQVARYFQSASQTRREYLQKRGKLASKALARTAAGEDRVFYKKVDRIDTSADVYLLCDGSGSMYKRKYICMSAAVMALTEALDAAKVPNKSVVFTEADPNVQHWTIKDWTERVNSDTMAEKFAAVNMHQNADGDNVMYAYRELLGRNSRRKILIVLSDGMPCCDRSGDADGYLKAVTSMIQGQGKVELYGIGILSDAVKRYYHEYTVLENAKSIESCVVDVVKQKIIGR